MDFIVMSPEALLCGFVVGFLICFTGVGGGVLVIPAVSFFFDQPPSVAVGTAGLYAALTKILAGAEHARIGNINYKLFARVAAAAAPGALLAAAIVNLLLHYQPEARDKLQDILRGAVIAAILLSLYFSQIRPKSAENKTAPETKAPLLIGAFAVGLVMGLTGVGGGVLIAPLLLTLGGETPKRIVGASILIALALSALSAAVYAGGGQINYELALWMTVGSMLATPLGSRLLRRVSEEFVRRSLVGLILAAAILMAAGG